jgi:NADH:ubiquinone oxidoreductase subunit 5 (subunit L)/multisubunit Na+/H+ antiporter MnhA subunit
MSAPTPVSAYLHSATMVKAGIYLMARLNPALGFTDLWFWLLSVTGLITMLVGAYVGLKQNDLKALLAYSTISQLGVLIVLIGQDTEIAFKALVIGIVAHALYKSALFLVAGIVDHETGTRDLRRLGGLSSSMRRSFVVASVAALSMAGLPPLFGFLAKETLLATATHPNVPPIVEWVFPAATVVAGALILAQAAMMIWDTFLGRPRDASVHGHEAPLPMWLAPAVPALLSLMIGLSPEPEAMARFLAQRGGSRLRRPRSRSHLPSGPVSMCRFFFPLSQSAWVPCSFSFAFACASCRCG